MIEMAPSAHGIAAAAPLPVARVVDTVSPTHERTNINPRTFLKVALRFLTVV